MLRIEHVESGFQRDLGEEEVFGDIAWAPGGKWVAAVVQGEEPQLRVYDTSGDGSQETPVASAEAQIAWSDDATRLIAVTPEEVVLYTPELEPVGRVSPEEEPEGGRTGRPWWGPESLVAVAFFRGDMLTMDRTGKAYVTELATIMPIDDTSEMTIVGWRGPGQVAVYDGADPGSPDLYVLNVEEGVAQVLSSSDLPEGAAPFDETVALVLESTGAEEAWLGESAAPTHVTWAVIPGPQMVLDREGVFLSMDIRVWPASEPAEIARRVAVLVQPELTE